ncbi:hypothetical protein B0T14DRAFT_566167 [Immersiella caudata]|uniref:Uncharacterized protein n=1 Tax=Immersiella caudata TaxID=314043 RepID=A0AA39WPN7_9PEZI|nr:hypothetical protein B0T14DRAFT_566167 [Immersiella caudata]
MLPQLLLYSTLLTPILALPATIVGHWTLKGLRRTCSSIDNMCEMSFILDENRGHDGVVACAFKYVGGAETDFGSLPCNDRVLVQGGWNTTAGTPEESFLTLVVTDKKIDAYGFFGAREQDFDQNGMVLIAVTRPAYRVGQFGPEPVGNEPESWSESESGSDGGSDEDGDSDSDEERRVRRQDSVLVQVSDLRRTWDDQGDVLFTSFDISTSEGDSVRCELRITGPEPEKSWYSRGPCEMFTISWGYDEMADSAVMSVCNYLTGNVAFIGFNGVSDFDKTYGPSRWEPSKPMGCK